LAIKKIFVQIERNVLVGAEEIIRIRRLLEKIHHIVAVLLFCCIKHDKLA